MKKRTETSKLLLWLLLSACGVVLIITCIYSLCTSDSNPLVTLIDKLFELSAVAVGFYYWKAKNENIRKFRQMDKKENSIDENEVHE